MYTQRYLKRRVDRKNFRKLFPNKELPFLNVHVHDMDMESIKALFLGENGVDIQRAETTFDNIRELACVETTDRVLILFLQSQKE